MRAKTIQEIAREEKDRIIEYVDFYLKEGIVKTGEKFFRSENYLYECFFLKLPLVDRDRYNRVLENEVKRKQGI